MKILSSFLIVLLMLISIIGCTSKVTTVNGVTETTKGMTPESINYWSKYLNESLTAIELCLTKLKTSDVSTYNVIIDKVTPYIDTFKSTLDSFNIAVSTNNTDSILSSKQLAIAAINSILQAGGAQLLKVLF